MVQTGRGKVQTQNDTAKFTAGKAQCGAVATCGSEVECSAYCPVATGPDASGLTKRLRVNATIAATSSY